MRGSARGRRSGGRSRAARRLGARSRSRVPTLAALAALFDPATRAARASASTRRPTGCSRSTRPARDLFDRAQRQFGSDRALVVVVGAPDVFDGAVPRGPRRARPSGSRRCPRSGPVLSLANAPDVRAEDGDVAVEPFLAEIPADAAGRAALRASVLGNPLYGGTLVAKDGRADGARRAASRASRTTRLMRSEARPPRPGGGARRVRRACPGVELWLTGGPHIQAEGARVLLAESLTLPLASLALLGAVLVLSFRTAARRARAARHDRARRALDARRSRRASGHALNAVTVLVPPLLITLGLSYAVHVVSESYEEARLHPGRHPARASWRTRSRGTATPLFTCGLTTAVGFGSLCLSPLAAVREFGWLALAGTLFSLVGRADLRAGGARAPAAAPASCRPPRAAVSPPASTAPVARWRASTSTAASLVFAAALAVLAVSLARRGSHSAWGRSRSRSSRPTRRCAARSRR